MDSSSLINVRCLINVVIIFISVNLVCSRRHARVASFGPCYYGTVSLLSTVHRSRQKYNLPCLLVTFCSDVTTGP